MGGSGTTVAVVLLLDSIHIVVVDDDPTTRERTVELLRARGHRVTGLDSAGKLVSLAQRAAIDVVVLDMRLEGASGAVRLLRADGRGHLGILLLSNDDASSRVEGLRLGADDCMGKPPDEAELALRVEVLGRTKRRFEAELAAALRSTAGTAREAELDPQTGLSKASVLEARLQDEWQRAVRHREPFAVSLASLRHAAWSPEVRADALRALGSTLLGILRPGDLATRIGDEEILVLLPGAHVAAAVQCTQRMHAQLAPTLGEGELSWGIAVCPSPSVVAREDLVRAAHQALAKAEREGNGSICLQEERAWILDPAG